MSAPASAHGVPASARVRTVPPARTALTACAGPPASTALTARTALTACTGPPASTALTARTELTAARAALALTILALTVLALTLGPSRVRAQTLEASGQADVPVLGDNLDQARTRAIREAQVQSLQQALAGLVAPEWRTLYERELRRRILSRLDRYLSGFRTTRSEPSADRTRYSAAVTAQFSRAPLVEDLRDLPLPVLGDPKRTLRILYEQEDPVLGNAALRQEILAQLQPRLELLNFQVTGATALTVPQAALLKEAGDTKRRTDLLARQRAEADLLVAFRLGALQAPAPAARDSVMAATLYHGAQGGVMGSFDERAAGPKAALRLRDFVLADLVAPLLLQLQPAALQPFSAFAGLATQLELRVTGLVSVAEEEGFGAAFFRRSSPFAPFYLARIERDALVYRGNIALDRRNLERDLKGRAFGDYVVRNVNWLDTALEVEVQATARPSHHELDLFPPEGRSASVQDTLQAFLIRGSAPELTDPLYAEHEDNGWLDRANALAFNVPIYGLVDARADADFYVAEELAEGESIEIVWARLERTNLMPVLRLYDDQGRQLRTIVPRLYTRFTYKVPAGQHGFYLEVADRFGFIHGESGGYLKFPYLLLVRRQSAL